MSRRTKRVAVVLALLFAGAVLLVLSRPREPRYEGRSLTYWAARLNQPEAQQALTAIGTNALPFLIKWLDEEPTRFGSWTWKIGQRLPDSIRPNPWPFGSRQDIASDVLGFFGAVAIPNLMKALEEDPRRHPAVVSTIVYMGWRKPRSPLDLRVIVAALDNIAAHPAKAVRLSVASLLLRLDREEIHKEVCLVWEKLLRDESSEVRTAAVEGAVRLLPGSPLLDLVAQLRDDPHPNVRNAVARVLQKAGRSVPMSEPVAPLPEP